MNKYLEWLGPEDDEGWDHYLEEKAASRPQSPEVPMMSLVNDRDRPTKIDLWLSREMDEFTKDWRRIRVRFNPSFKSLTIERSTVKGKHPNIRNLRRYEDKETNAHVPTPYFLKAVYKGGAGGKIECASAIVDDRIEFFFPAGISLIRDEEEEG